VGITPLVLALQMMLRVWGRRSRMAIWSAMDGQLRRQAQDRTKPAARLPK